MYLCDKVSVSLFIGAHLHDRMLQSSGGEWLHEMTEQMMRCRCWQNVIQNVNDHRVACKSK